MMVKFLKVKISANKLLIIATCLGLLVVLFYKLPFLHSPYGYDQSAYLFEGKELSLGAVPYRDIWDIRLLGLGYIYALLFKIGISSLSAMRVIELSWLLVTLLAFSVLVGKIFKNQLAAAVGIIYFSLLSSNFVFSGYDGGGYVEPYLALPSILLLLSLILFGRSRKAIWLILAGVSVFVAVMIRPTSIALVLPGIVYLYYLYRPTSATHKFNLRQFGRGIIIPFIVFTVPLLAYLLYLNHYGALRELSNAMTKYNSYYSKTIPEINRNDAGLYSMTLYSLNNLLKYVGKYPLSYFVALFGLIGLIWRYKPFHTVILLFFLIGLAGVASGMKPWPHYFIQLFPVLAILASYSFVFISDSLTPYLKNKPYQSGLLALFLFFFIFPYIIKPFADSLNEFQTFKTGSNTYESQVAHDPLVAYARENFKEGDYAIFWDIPYHYLATGMRGSTRYYSQNFLTNNFGLKNTFVTQEVVETFLADVRNKPPRISVIAKDAFDEGSPILEYFKSNYQVEPILSSGSNFVFIDK